MSRETFNWLYKD